MVKECNGKENEIIKESKVIEMKIIDSISNVYLSIKW